MSGNSSTGSKRKAGSAPTRGKKKARATLTANSIGEINVGALVQSANENMEQLTALSTFANALNELVAAKITELNSNKCKHCANLNDLSLCDCGSFSICKDCVDDKCECGTVYCGECSGQSCNYCSMNVCQTKCGGVDESFPGKYGPEAVCEYCADNYEY